MSDTHHATPHPRQTATGVGRRQKPGTGPIQPPPSIGPTLGLAHSRCLINISFPERTSPGKHQATACPSMPELLSTEGHPRTGPGTSPGTRVAGRLRQDRGEGDIPQHTQKAEETCRNSPGHCCRCPQQRKKKRNIADGGQGEGRG